MEDIKIWAIGGDKNVSSLAPTEQTETEELLEEILVANPSMLEDGLRLVGRQTPASNGNLDLLGVDSDGRLVVFELKRGKLNREAIAQVIDYASSLDSMETQALIDHIVQRSGTGGIERITRDEFEEWYADSFPDLTLESLKPLRMTLVGLGVDNTTERMVSFLLKGEIEIFLVTFYGFKNPEGTFLARHVESDAGKSSTRTLSSKNPSRDEQRRAFENLASDLGISDVANSVRQMLQETIKEQVNRLNEYGVRSQGDRLDSGFDYKDWWKSEIGYNPLATIFVELGISESGNNVNLGFYPIAVHLASEQFSSLPEDCDRWERAPTNAFRLAGFDQEVKVSLYSLDDWERYETQLKDLVRSVCRGYRSARQRAESESAVADSSGYAPRTIDASPQ